MLQFLKTIAIVVVVTLFFADNAFAYLDPGTGSVILQVIAAAVLGALFTIKSYWHRFKAFFSKKHNSENTENKDGKDSKDE